MNWLADCIDRHRRLCALVIVSLTILAVPGIARLRYSSDPMGSVPQKRSASAVLKRVHEAFGSQTLDCVLLVQSCDVFTVAGVSGLRDLCRRLESLEGVAAVFSLDHLRQCDRLLPRRLLPADPTDAAQLQAARTAALSHPLAAGRLISPDARSTLVLVRFTDRAVETAHLLPTVQKVRQIAQDVAREFAIDVAVTGTPAIRADMVRFMRAENRRLLLSPLLAGAAVGLLVFRRLSPLLLVGIPPSLGVLWTLGALGWMHVEWTVIALAIPAMIYVVGFSDAIHLVLCLRREGDEPGRSPRERALRAIREIGPACVLTSLTTAVGFGSLVLADSAAVRTFGVSCAVGTLMNLACVVTLIPLLAATTLGTRTVAALHSCRADRLSSLLLSFAQKALRHHRVVCGLGTGLTLLLSWSVLRLHVDSSSDGDWIPRRCESIEAYQKCARAFGAVSRLDVLVDWSDSSQGSPAMLLQALDDVHKVFEREPATLKPVSALTVQRCAPSVLGRAGLALPALQIWMPDLARQFLCLEDRCALVDALFAGSSAGENERCFARIEGELETLSRKYPDLRFRLAGYLLATSRGVYEIVRDLGRSFALTVAVIAVMLLVAFRSARYGAVCLVPNILPLAVIAALLLVLGKPVNAANAMVFTICLAIAVDDTIHLMSRYRQQRATGRQPGEACHRSLRMAGRAMVVSTLVFVGGFGALASSRLVGYRIFALLACSGFAAALIGDLLILPALLIWLDDRNPS